MHQIKKFPLDILKVTAVAILTFVLFAAFVSCSKTSEQKVADAKANIVAANQDVKDVVAEANAQTEWLNFKSAGRLKVAANNKVIADYRTKMTNADGKLVAKYDKKIDALEKKNDELNTKLNDYKDTGKSTWEQFKTEFTHDMDELGTALKDFTVDNKK